MTAAMTNRLRLICITTASLALAGCSSVFYQPTRYEYVDRTQLHPVPEEISFASEDGTQLHGWLFHAEHPKGTIVHFHGNAQNLSAHFRFLRHAVVAGYDHFIFDYRGYGQSAGKPEPLGVVADGRAALRWARARTPAAPLIVFGQSLGGAIALRTLSDLNGEVPVRLLVLDSTFMNYRSAARRVLAQTWLTWPLQPVAWAVVDNAGAPPADLRGLKVGRAIVVHGRADRVVPYVLGQRVFEALPEPKEMWEVPGGVHTDFLWRLSFEKRFFAALDQASG
jgi:pimeloyl-ACP methyl ester carboxylesterase